jgi:hypothetical protein
MPRGTPGRRVRGGFALGIESLHPRPQAPRSEDRLAVRCPGFPPSPRFQPFDRPRDSVGISTSPVPARRPGFPGRGRYSRVVRHFLSVVAGWAARPSRIRRLLGSAGNQPSSAAPRGPSVRGLARHGRLRPPRPGSQIERLPASLLSFRARSSPLSGSPRGSPFILPGRSGNAVPTGRCSDRNCEDAISTFLPWISRHCPPPSKRTMVFPARAPAPGFTLGPWPVPAFGREGSDFGSRRETSSSSCVDLLSRRPGTRRLSRRAVSGDLAARAAAVLHRDPRFREIRRRASSAGDRLQGLAPLTSP